MKFYWVLFVVPATLYSQTMKIHLPMQAKLQYEHKTFEGRVSVQNGLVDISRSSKLNLKLPSTLSIVDDGKFMWYYDIPLKQVTVYPHSELWDTLFWDVKKLKQKYSMKVIHQKSYTRYKLKPKHNMDIKRLIVDVSKQHNLISFSYVDNFDDTHTYNFLHIRHGKSDKKSYQFTVPKGIDVIRYDN
ncbi:MAG TPA: outer-membrane lipoprotein carrier protein LolA [Gammaproteobacteria bacterium]|nr:outer-membrane lipoprotein carrier protein LolA [Gammaproteobacteria bacterium]